MTDNEIMKVLECCAKPVGEGCNECPLDLEACWNSNIDGLALDLINRQKAEIERLKARNDELNKLNKTVAIDTIKEFWNTLKSQNTLDRRIISVESGDNLLKEMVGDE